MFWSEKARGSPLQRWTGALTEVVLRRVPGRLVVFVDELDAVRSLPFSTDEFFASIRELYNYWTGGHPYLTQRLCRVLAEDPAIVDAPGVDRACSALFLARRPREQDDNLAFVRERILRGGSDPAALVNLYADVRRSRNVKDDEADARVSELRLSGIVRGDGGRLRVRNRIYERVFDQSWIVESLPGAEVRRQKAAYRRGFLRAAAVAAVVVGLIGALAVFASCSASGRGSKRLEAAGFSTVPRWL